MTEDRGEAPIGVAPIWIAALLIAAAIPRLIAINDDFWLDEIWSLQFSKLVEGPLDVLFRPELRHDNNHPLNTLWMYALGEVDSCVAYRVPAVLAGLVTVLLAVVAGSRRSRTEGLVAGLVFATSYLMIAYSTEARGYALAVACALGALLLFERAYRRGGWGTVAGFWGVVTVGFLSHFSFGHAYFALLGWSAWRVLAARGARRANAGRLAALHGVPVAVVVGLYLAFVRGMAIGGGPQLSVAEVLSRTLAWTLGGPVSAATGVALGAVVIVALALSTIWSWREGNDRWIFDLAAVVLAPAATLIVLEPEFLAPRYFLIAVAFFLLVWARVLARLLSRGSWVRAIAAVLLLASVAGNACHVVPFLQQGRGEYVAALRYMAEHTEGPVISVARYPDTSSPMILAYHAKRSPSDKEWRYFRHRRLPPEGVEWYVVNVQVGQPQPGPRLRLGRHGYELREKFGYSAPGGLAWWVYRRI